MAENPKQARLSPLQDMAGFEAPFAAAVFGASGGIGAAMTDRLLACESVAHVHTFSRRPPAREHARLDWQPVDLEDEASLQAAAGHVRKLDKAPLRLVIVASGLLHDATMQPEKALRHLDPSHMSRAFAVNATGPALVAKHLLPLMPRRGRSVLAALSARVGSIGDNRAGGWYAYRASKAALNMLLKNIAIEAGRKYPDLVVLGLQPGTVDTALSRPFQGAVKQEDLFTPQQAANALLRTIDELDARHSGGLFDWAGEAFPP